MKSQISLILAVVVTFMILECNADQNLIESTCKRTPNYKLCIAIIRADRGSAAADLPGLGLIVVDAVDKNSRRTIATINSLTKSSPKKLLPPLKRCKEVYTTIVEGDVPTVQQSIRGDPKFSETAMADASIEASICEEAFEGVAPSPLSKQNKFVSDAADVARAIIRNLL